MSRCLETLLALTLLGFLLAPAAQLSAQTRQFEAEEEEEEEESNEPVIGDPHGQHNTWVTERPTIQAEQDGALRPAGTGAIFAPAMTSSSFEPLVVVRQDGREIATSPMGTKIFVPPGTYDVFVGTGTPETQLEFEVVVVEGRITFIPVEWGGLVVRVVDERGNAFRGTYDLVRMPSREYVGIGLGAVIREGETLTTWLLEPGTYMILAAGESYQARKNFVTLPVDAGRLTQYTLVLDEATGDLLGAGEVQLGGSGIDPDNNLTVSLVLGGRVEFNNASDVPGKNNGAALGVTGFLESIISYINEGHLLYGRFSIDLGGRIEFGVLGEEGRDKPFVPNVDETILEFLYVYRVAPWFGPYGRFTFESNVLPGVQEFEVERDVAKFNDSGALIPSSDPTCAFSECSAFDTQLNSSFAPIDLDFGTGARFALRAGSWLNLSARLGFGGRQVFTRDLFVVDDPEADPIVYRQRPNRTQFGFEAALITELSITRWVLLKIDANILDPFVSLPNENNLTTGELLADPVLDFRGTLALRITSIASINYTIRIISDSAIQDRTQIDQSILLRIAYKVF